MTTHDILQLDCRTDKNKEIIQRVLRKIKPLANCSEEQVPLHKIERCMQILCKKHDYVVTLYADPSSNDKSIIWRCAVIQYGRSVTSGVNVYGCSVYEAIAKATVLMYSHSRRVNK